MPNARTTPKMYSMTHPRVARHSIRGQSADSARHHFLAVRVSSSVTVPFLNAQERRSWARKLSTSS